MGSAYGTTKWHFSPFAFLTVTTFPHCQHFHYKLFLSEVYNMNVKICYGLNLNPRANVYTNSENNQLAHL